MVERTLLSATMGLRINHIDNRSVEEIEQDINELNTAIKIVDDLLAQQGVEGSIWEDLEVAALERHDTLEDMNEVIRNLESAARDKSLSSRTIFDKHSSFSWDGNIFHWNEEPLLSCSWKTRIRALGLLPVLFKEVLDGVQECP